MDDRIFFPFGIGGCECTPCCPSATTQVTVLRGSMGPRGATGPQGPAGQIGPAGQTGPAGATGATGATEQVT